MKKEEVDAIRHIYNNLRSDVRTSANIDTVPDNEDIVMVGVRWGTQTIANSKKYQCAKCNKDIALSPSSQEIINSGRLKIEFSCLPCVVSIRSGKPN